MIRFLPFAALLLAAADPGTPATDLSQRAQSTQPLPSLFSDEDYPAVAVRAHEEGTVGFRLLVGPGGLPSGCSVTRSSGSLILDSTTCRLLMARARFRPALDKAGKPAGDSFNGRIVWRMGVPLPPRVEAARMLWLNCLWGEASKWVPGDLAPAEAAERAFAACTALEGLLAGETGETLPLDGRRISLRSTLEAGVGQTREVLANPAKPEEGP
jgi:TonB family protein